VLVTKNDFVIIDFEGEPGRPLDERRAKRSPLRDVAGMLRSFGYAASAALRSMDVKETEREPLLAAAARWHSESRAAFLAGYRAAAAEAGLLDELWPSDGLLALYEAEKALYELRYELDNRPDWVGIPLQGLLDLGAA
jgi:maltose alpha-D-glucosyltransferase/alpha-amylase